jgi:hypothetical protein
MAKSVGVVRRVSAHRSLSALVAVGAALMLVAPVTAQSADESASPGQADDLSTDGVRAGWILHTLEEPAFSIQLPPGWAIGSASDGLLGATGPDGETLVVRLDESATGEPLGTYTQRSWRTVEKDVEALLADGRDVAGGTPTAPVYRQAAGGPVARLGVARSADKVSDGSHVTARFLTAPCEDGARTLEITGPAPQPGTDQGPDAWDSIAASVSPCSSEPMPELVLGPEVVALRGAYLATVEEVNPRLFAAVDELFSGGSFKKWAKDSGRVADVYDEYVQLLPGLPWTVETLPLSDAQTAKYREMAAFYRTRLAKATTNREIDRLIKQVERLDASLLPATAAVRLAIGLPAATTSLDVGDPVE